MARLAQVGERIHRALHLALGARPVQRRRRQERRDVEHLEVVAHELAEVRDRVFVLRKHAVELFAHRPELAGDLGEHLRRVVEAAVAQQQVAAQQLAVGDVLAVGHGDAQHLERALGARRVAHPDVDPGDLVQRGVEQRRGARHRLIRLDRAVELILLVAQPSDREPRELDDAALVLARDLDVAHAMERVDRRAELAAQQIDDADEVARLGEVRAALADRFERRAAPGRACAASTFCAFTSPFGALGVVNRDAVQVLGAKVVGRGLDLGRRQLAQAREVVVDAVEVADVDRDLDQAPERALHVRRDTPADRRAR